LPEGLDSALAEALSTLPWRETFIDGMRGGWVPELQDFYSAPTSFFGAVKIYYNRDLFNQAKQVLRQATAAAPLPHWYTDLILRVDDAGQTRGYLPDTP